MYLDVNRMKVQVFCIRLIWFVSLDCLGAADDVILSFGVVLNTEVYL